MDSFTEGESAWRYGVAGFFTRLRGLIVPIVLTIVTIGSPWWLPQSTRLPSALEIPVWSLFMVGAIVIGGSVMGGLYYLRRRTIRSLEIKGILHRFTHYLRDHQTRMFKNTQGRTADGAASEGHLSKFSDYVDRVCEFAKDYFERMTHDSTINCAVRLAVEVDDVRSKGTRVVYRTLGRSSGLSSDRANTTEDILSNQGIPRFLIDEHACKAVLRYNDLDKAAKVGVFRMTKNDTKYRDEIQTMMVAPINAWDGKRASMIGLLYITSRNKRVFKRKHVDCMRFIADATALSVCFTVQRIRESGIGNVTRDRS